MHGTWDVPEFDPVIAGEAGRQFVVGMTGGVGSGKSTAAVVLEQLGVSVIDADQIAHRLTSPAGTAIDAIRSCFGAAMIDGRGALDRVRMRAMAFEDGTLRRQLESILHPLIRTEIVTELGRLGRLAEQSSWVGKRPGTPTYVLLVLPLLIETGASYRQLINRILVVDCPESRQLSQVVLRSALDFDQVRRIIAAQAPRALRLQLADDILSNTGSLEALHADIRRLHRQYCDSAQRANANGLT